MHRLWGSATWPPAGKAARPPPAAAGGGGCLFFFFGTGGRGGRDLGGVEGSRIFVLICFVVCFFLVFGMSMGFLRRLVLNGLDQP